MQMTTPKLHIWLQGFLLSLFLLLGSSANLVAGSLYSTDHDFYYKKYVGMYMPTVHWKALKAQCYAESSFRVDAVSPVGAKGLCQFMDGTWGDVSRKLGISAHPFDPKFSIQFASFYMAEMRSNWTSPRPEFDRHSLAMASYNAGFGNLLRAQRLCHGSIFYDSIVDCLPQVTGRHSKETTEYVNKIWVYYLKLWLL